MTRSLAILIAVVTIGAGCNSRTTFSSASVLSPGTYDFVLSEVTIDPGGSSVMTGFNLDGAFTASGDSTGCQKVDRLSSLDPDQNSGGCGPSTPSCAGGVDNQLPAFYDNLDQFPAPDDRPTQRQKLAAAIAAGRITTLVRLSGVDDLQSDPDVQVALFRAFPTTTDCAHLFDGTGHFVVTSDSVMGSLSAPRWVGSGSIVEGRLRVVVPAIDDLAGYGGEMPLPVTQVTLRVSLAGDGSGGVYGSVGGWLETHTFRKFLVALLPIWGSPIDVLMGELPDRAAPDGECGGWWFEYAGDISFGAGFSLKAATIDGVATSRTAGACGTN